MPKTQAGSGAGIMGLEELLETIFFALQQSLDVLAMQEDDQSRRQPSKDGIGQKQLTARQKHDRGDTGCQGGHDRGDRSDAAERKGQHPGYYTDADPDREDG